MKCSCGSEVLVGTVTITKALPLAARRGSVKVGGEKVTQVDLKDAWDNDPSGKPRDIKGPISCLDCGNELFYVEGAPRNPYVGDIEVARSRGAQFFRDGGQLKHDDASGQSED